MTDDEAWEKWGRKAPDYDAKALEYLASLRTNSELTRRLREEAKHMMPGIFRRYGL